MPTPSDETPPTGEQIDRVFGELDAATDDMERRTARRRQAKEYVKAALAFGEGVLGVLAAAALKAVIEHLEKEK